MTVTPPLEPTGAWLLLAFVGTWALARACVAFVRWFDRLDRNPPEFHHWKDTMTRHPLRVAASIVGGLTALAQGLVGAGLFTPDQGTATTGLIAAVVTLLGTFGLVVSAEPKITPLTDPRDDSGRPLLPAPAHTDPAVPPVSDLD